MLYKIFSSYITTLLLLLVLAVAGAVGTFIENDFGSYEAKTQVYYSWWFLLIFFLSLVNLFLTMINTKMYRFKGRFIFHFSFFVILFGAIVTHFFGVDGVIHIREGQKTNTVFVGQDRLTLPFYVKLQKFHITRYPGSRSPSNYSSDVIILDPAENLEKRVVVSMNRTFSYKRYKFFQASYDSDEKGTKLSVNNDPGVELTYFGYGLLLFGLVLNFFDRKSRFQILLRKVKKFPIAIFIILIMFGQPPKALASDYLDNYLLEFKLNSKKMAELIGELVVQGPMGRMKPLDTQNREVLLKLSGRDHWKGMSANQVILGAFSRPEIWKQIPIIRVGTEKLKKKIGVNKDQKLVRFLDFFDEKLKYKLTKEVEAANKIPSAQRGTYERDLIKVDERLNILFMTYRGVLLTIFPLPENERNKWVDFKTMFANIDHSEVKRATSKILDACYNRDCDKATSSVQVIKEYQKTYGHQVLPSKNHITIEVWFNKLNLFFKLSLIYLVIGILFLTYSLSSIFYNKMISKKIKSISLAASSSLAFVHALGLCTRWYLSGRAPLASTYETMVYISLAALLAPLLFFRRSLLVLGTSFIVAGIFTFSAYLGEVDPQITNLVPVLKSKWLSIHVSVITASYGFFAVGAILGVLMLLLISSRCKKHQHIDQHIKTISHINEVMLILGLSFLIIGNFLGGIWANESWGRYWGWDPKETWAFVSILVYSITIHLRLLTQIYTDYLFAVASVISFASILMTYFGVNFYLSGMHSYATGEPVAIPNWVFGLSVLTFLTFLIAYPKRKQIED